MKRTTRVTALAITTTLGVSLLAPLAAQASEEGKRNTTLGLAAAAAALLLTQKNKLPGVVAAAGAAYAYTQYDASVRNRHRRERNYGYDDYRYRRGDNGYRSGDYGYRNGDYGYQNDSYSNRPHGGLPDDANQNGYRYNENGPFSNYRYSNGDYRSRATNLHGGLPGQRR